MSSQRWIRRLGLAALIGVSSVTVAATSSPGAQVDAQSVTLGAGGEYHPLVPFRAFDSRPGSAINDPAPGRKPIDPAREFSVNLAGVGELPSSTNDVLAVVATVTVVDPDGSGWLAVRPAGVSIGSQESSLVNFVAGRNVPNVVIVGLGADGAVTVRMGPSSSSSAHVLIDVVGFLSTSSYTGERGARLVPVGPARLTDTREVGGPLGAGKVLTVPIRGAESYMPKLDPAVPDDPSVTAALVNVAAVNNRSGSKSTFLTAAPAPPKPPVPTSNVNVVAGQIKTGLAVVPVVNGNIYIYNHAGVTDVIVDVLGYFRQSPADDESTTGRIVPLEAPFRAFDTREAAFGNAPLGTFTVEDWSFEDFAGSVTLATGGGLDLSQQSALLGNLTATDLDRLHPTVPTSTYLTAFPGGESRPLVANLNVAEGEAVPNMSLISYAQVDDDPYIVQMYNHMGSVHYLLDVYAIVLE